MVHEELFRDAKEQPAIPAIEIVKAGSVQGWLMPPSESEVKEVIDAAIASTEEFHHRKDSGSGQQASCDDDGDLALEYAWRKFDQTERFISGANAKEEALLRNAVVFTAAELGVVKALKLVPNWYFCGSFTCGVAFIAILIYCRQTRMSPALTHIDEMLKRLWEQKTRRWWLAASLHVVVASALPKAIWKMRMHNLATWLFIFALGFLIPTAMTIEPKPSDDTSAHLESAALEVEAQNSEEESTGATKEAERVEAEASEG